MTMGWVNLRRANDATSKGSMLSVAEPPRRGQPSSAISAIAAIGSRPAGVALSVAAMALVSGAALAGKDVGPGGRCDGIARGTPQWVACVGPARADLSDGELFYAGYWMARLGRYDAALSYLAAVKTPDTRTLTYIVLRPASPVMSPVPLFITARRSNSIPITWWHAPTWVKRTSASVTLPPHAGNLARLQRVAVSPARPTANLPGTYRGQDKVPRKIPGAGSERYRVHAQLPSALMADGTRQILSVPSAPVVAMRWPSGEKRASVTAPLCPV